MTIYKEIIINAISGKETKINFTSAELQQFQTKQTKENEKALLAETEKTEKAEARLAAEAKLIELGLTTEDLKALLG